MRTRPDQREHILTSIKDKNNVALLTFTRDGNNAIAQVSDRYGRSVYYHVGSYQTTGVPLAYTQSVAALDHVSQVVPTGTASPPDRHVFGYTNVSNGESSEAIPMLHTVTTPSATGASNRMVCFLLNDRPCTIPHCCEFTLCLTCGMIIVHSLSTNGVLPVALPVKQGKEEIFVCSYRCLSRSAGHCACRLQQFASTRRATVRIRVEHCRCRAGAGSRAEAPTGRSPEYGYCAYPSARRYP